MQDSLYIDQNTLLGTHTTAIQMMVLEKSAPNLPIKVVCPGKVYRRDDDDATHSHQSCRWKDWLLEKSYSIRP